MNNYYFTFGSDEKYPYGRNDYVLVQAENLQQAIHLFQAVHPNRPDSIFVNCAFFYEEEQFNEFREKYYKDVLPVEIISVQRRDD